MVKKQIFFSQCLARFIFDLQARGYGVTMGEAWRPPETCALYDKQGKGITNSLHVRRLAVDLNIFLNGELISTNKEIADLWQSYSTDLYQCSAGFYFITRPDADHFSVEDNGIK